MTRPGQAFREIALYGVCGGILIAALRLAEYRFLVLRHSVEIYGVRVEGPFVLDEARVRELQLTPRELEILALIAEGLSNKEIAERVFVSENTVKTHASRVFDKLGARRRTEAVQFGKSWRLIP